MPQIIIPTQHRSDGRPFAELAGDPALQIKAMRQFMAILAKSFQQDALTLGVDAARRHLTDAEKKRRADIMQRWYRELRALGFGHIRAMDELPKALRAELDGLPYTPPERRRVWAPGGDV